MSLSHVRVRNQLKAFGYCTLASAYQRAAGRYVLRVRKLDGNTVSVFVDLDDDNDLNAKHAQDVANDLRELGYDVKVGGSSGFRLTVTLKDQS